MEMESYIFDLDGTLLDGSEELKMNVLFECIQSFGNSALKDFWFENSAYFPEALYTRGNNTNERLQPFVSMSPEYHGKIVQDFLVYFNRERKTVHQRLSESAKFSLYPDAEKCLQRLNGSRIGIFTDSSNMQVTTGFTKTPALGKYFGPFHESGHIVTQDDVPDQRKPHPAGIQLLMKKMDTHPDHTIYSDDMYPGIQSAVSAAVNRIYWIDRNNTTVGSRNTELNLLVQTGRVVRGRTLDVLSRPRVPYAVIMRGQQGVGKSTVISDMPFPIANVGKDYIAHREGWNWSTRPDYNSVRDELYEKFTLSALETICRYGCVCLGAPFTRQDDVSQMIHKIRK